MDSQLGHIADEVLSEGSSLIEIPAGCGKTELLAAFARRAADSGGKSLALTHTHAGVDVLRRRLRKLNVPRGSVALFTIASWSRRLVTHFPRLSGFDSESDADPWDEAYRNAGRALAHPHVASLVTDTYSLILVDEYQDCTVDQGVVISRFAELAPTIVIGDRLQGIYGFGSNELADWDDLGLPSLEVDHSPWRWKGRNEELGQWLLDQRQLLLDGQPIDLSSAPVSWVEDTAANRRSVLHRLADGDGTVAIMDGFRDQRVATAKSLRGRFGVMEELEGKAMLTFAERFDTGDGFLAAGAVIEFVKGCFTNVPSTYTSKTAALERRALPRYRDGECKPALDALVGLVKNTSPAHLVNALTEAEAIPSTTLICREAWSDVLRAARWALESADQEPIALRDCVTNLRDRARVLGRRPENRTVSSTLLIKGLEYDRCAVLAAHTLDARNLYVAMTRARDQLVVMSQTPQLNPASE